MLRLLSQDKKNTERQKCVLCLPKYGLFSHKKENILEEELKYNKITKTFFLVEIAECMAGFLNHGFELESV